MLILVFPTINQVECRLDLDFAFFKYIALAAHRIAAFCSSLLTLINSSKFPRLTDSFFKSKKVLRRHNGASLESGWVSIGQFLPYSTMTPKLAVHHPNISLFVIGASVASFKKFAFSSENSNFLDLYIIPSNLEVFCGLGNYLTIP